MSTAQDLPPVYGEPVAAAALRLVPPEPLDFDAAVIRLQPRLHRYAVRRLGDFHEAEELVQEALLRAYTHSHQLRTEDDLAAWATVVTGRLVIDRLRVRGRSFSVADVPETGRVGRDTADVVVGRDEARLALDALDAMPSRQASILWAREVEGHSYEELCDRFGMSEPAVRSLLTRARKALRREYAVRGGTLPVGGLAVLAPWIAGLTWAERLRKAAARVTVPAALSAAGISALGGLVLSPFGILNQAPTTFQPAHAVVSRNITEVVPHTPNWMAVTGWGGRSGSSDASAKAPGPRWTLPTVKDAEKHHVPCVNSANSDGDAGTITVPTPALPGRPAAGAPSCDQNRAAAGSTLYVAEPLPDNPTGVTYVGVASDSIDCTAVPGNPVVKCTPQTTQQGATK